MNVGIIGIGLYLPTERMTGEEIANLADIPVHIVKVKNGY